MARGAIGAVGDKQMIAGLKSREQGERDGGKTRGRKDGISRARQFAPSLFERAGGRRSFGAIGLGNVPLREALDAGIKDRRAAIDGRVDEAELLVGIAARMDEAGATAQLFACIVRELRHEGP